jgi:hypothetical protein
MAYGRGWLYKSWYKYGWWCPRHPWPPAWARAYWPPPGFHYPPTLDPQEELKMLETVKREIEENMRSLEVRIRELKEVIEKGKAK